MAEYGGRPWWHWALIYLVIGGVIYGLVYYFVLAKPGGGYSAPSSSSQPAPAPGY